MDTEVNKPPSPGLMSPQLEEESNLPVIPIPSLPPLPPAVQMDIDTINDNNCKQTYHQYDSEDTENSEAGMPDCTNRICYYFDGPDNEEPLTHDQRKLYHCEKCSGVDICVKCANVGAHSRHKDYLHETYAAEWIT